MTSCIRIRSARNMVHRDDAGSSQHLTDSWGRVPDRCLVTQITAARDAAPLYCISPTASPIVNSKSTCSPGRPAACRDHIPVDDLQLQPLPRARKSRPNSTLRPYTLRPLF
jgi:hypothetical protein